MGLNSRALVFGEIVIGGAYSEFCCINSVRLFEGEIDSDQTFNLVVPASFIEVE